MKSIPNYPGYRITKDGQVWSDKTNMWLKPSLISGYFAVNFWNYCIWTNHNIGRLVLETYIGPCPANMECRHLDGDKQNDNLVNLAWGTHYV